MNIEAITNLIQNLDTNIFKTLFVAVVIFLTYKISIYYIEKKDISIEEKYKIKKSYRNTLLIIFIFISFILWSGEIKTLLLSAAAITAAMIIAFKEIILCIVGSILIKSNDIFDVGDYIEYDNIRGKVINKSLLYTKLLVGQSLQAQELNIPNVVFFTNKVSNLSRFGEYQKYDLLLFVPNIEHISQYKKVLESFLDNYVKENKQKYIDYFKKQKEKDFLFEVPKKYYTVQYNLTDGKNIRIKVSLLSHPLEYKTLEDEIIDTYIEAMEKELIKDKTVEIKNEN